MQVVQPTDVTAFLERAGPVLAGEEARHNLILGLAGTLRDRPEVYADVGLWLVEEDGDVVGAALRTRPRNLVLARCTDAAAERLARAIEERLPGVVGAVPEVDRFVAARPEAAHVRQRQGIYALDRLVPPTRPAVGTPRRATSADRALLVEWWRDFAVEALGETDPDERTLAATVDHRLVERTGGIALWEHEGRPVSAVGFGSPTPTGIRIGPVFTPPAERGHGFASALTAHVSATCLAAGRRFCFLYTDLANPTSNGIYVALGYGLVCESAEYAFA